MMKKMTVRGSVFQIWRSFILFILIPVVCLNIAIAYLLYDMENTARELVGTKLAQVQYFLNQDINESLAVIGKMGGNASIQRLASLEKPLMIEDYEAVLDAKKYRQDAALSSEAYDISILFNRNDVFLTENVLCTDMDTFYGNTYEFGTLKLQSLKEEGFRGHHLTFYPYLDVKSGQAHRKGILYTTPLTEYAGREAGATAITLLREDNIKRILAEFKLWSGMAYVMDAEGAILYQTGDETMKPVSFPLKNSQENLTLLSDKLFGKGNLALSASIRTGLQIVAVIPEKSLFMKMDGLKVFIWILNGTTMIMCLSLSFRLARKRSRILTSALEMMAHKPDQKENVFSALHASVSSLVEDNTSLKHALGEQRELLQSVFWSRVLSVNTMSDEEIVRLAESAGMEIGTNPCCLLLIGLLHKTDMEAESWNMLLEKREEVLNSLRKSCGQDVYLGSQGMDQLILLLPVPADQRESYHGYAAERTGNLKLLMEHDAMLLCTGSMLIEHPRDICQAYAMCGNQLNLVSGYEEMREIIWCGEEGIGTESAFYFSDELKNQIILWIKSGQKKLVKDGFQRILEENYLKHRLGVMMEGLLVSKLKLTLYGAYDRKMKLQMDQVFEKIDTIQTDAWLFSYIWRVALEMCDYYMENIRSHEDGMQKKIVSYIEEHYREYSFDLASVASFCNLSESYFSQIFKEIMGENFSAYVEKKRMNYAYRLIAETEGTIDSVAEKTGYSNTNAFRKAYKRFFGISPSQTRKKGEA